MGAAEHISGVKNMLKALPEPLSKRVKLNNYFVFEAGALCLTSLCRCVSTVG